MPQGKTFIRRGWLGRMDRGKGCACSSLFSPSGWYIHLESIQGTDGGKYIVPVGIATGAKSQIVGRGNHGCCESTEMPSGGVEPCDPGHELSSSFSRSLLASVVLGDLGPSAVFHVPIYAELLCHRPWPGLASQWVGAVPQSALLAWIKSLSKTQGGRSHFLLADNHS